MNISDYKDGIIVIVKGKDYGTYKTNRLLPKGNGARLVEVLHSSNSNEQEWAFALIRNVRLVDIRVIPSRQDVGSKS